MASHRSDGGPGAVEYDELRVAILPDEPEVRKKKYSRIRSKSASPSIGGSGELEGPTGSSQQDSRRDAKKDHDKIYYSRAWRRLAGVTQVVSPDGEDTPIHNRMTHSEKVSLTAWAIASNLINSEDDAMKSRIAQLGGLDLDIVSTAGLAHDLGHPPFGHASEHELNEWAQEKGLIDGFEGNAQTFRIVTRLARHNHKQAGLRLRVGTLAAISKYPWIRGAELEKFRDVRTADDYEAFKTAISRITEDDFETKRYWMKYGAYYSDEAMLTVARRWMPSQFINGALRLSQSLEASVMDCADDIAYAVHDFEDFSNSGIVDWYTLKEECEQWTRWKKRKKRGDDSKGSIDDENWCKRVRDQMCSDYPRRFDDDECDSAVEWLSRHTQRVMQTEDIPAAQRFVEDVQHSRTTRWLNKFVAANSFEVVEDGQVEQGEPVLRMRPEPWHRIGMLKALTRGFVVETPVVAAHQRAVRAAVRSLADALYDWAYSSSRNHYTGLPFELRVLIKEAEKTVERDDEGKVIEHERGKLIARAVLDYICSLSDRNVRTLASRLNGQDAGPLLAGML